jgi:hypothetical protein
MILTVPFDHPVRPAPLRFHPQENLCPVPRRRTVTIEKTHINQYFAFNIA